MSVFSRRLTVIVLLVLAVSLGWRLGREYDARKTAIDLATIETGTGHVLTDPQHQANLTLLWSVWDILNQNYIEPTSLTEGKLVFGAAQGLTRAIGDPYTVLMSPDEVKNFRASVQGSLEGIGAELNEKNGVIVVVAPLKGSPAEKAGLLPEDVLYKVNDEVISGLTLDEVVGKVRGPKGTTVKITVYRKGNPAPIEMVIERAAITVPSVETEVLTDTGSGRKVGHLTLNQFGDTSVQEVSDALADFQKQKINGLVMDLRFNGGGYLDGAVSIASMFLKDGVVVNVQKRTGDPEILNVTGKPLYPDIPLAVLINEASASASEILAGALQDHHRAEIVGEKSFGKGTVQDFIDLPDGSALKVTTAHWLTPNGKNLAKEGVMPDIVIQRTAEDFTAGRDPQLQAAVAWVVGQK